MLGGWRHFLPMTATPQNGKEQDFQPSLDNPDDFILAIVEFPDADAHRVVDDVRCPFQREPDFGVNYDFAELLPRAETPR